MSNSKQRKSADISIRAWRAMLRTAGMASLLAAAACGSYGGPATSGGLAETNDLVPADLVPVVMVASIGNPFGGVGAQPY